MEKFKPADHVTWGKRLGQRHGQIVRVMKRKGKALVLSLGHNTFGLYVVSLSKLRRRA